MGSNEHWILQENGENKCDQYVFGETILYELFLIFV